LPIAIYENPSIILEGVLYFSVRRFVGGIVRFVFLVFEENEVFTMKKTIIAILLSLVLLAGCATNSVTVEVPPDLTHDEGTGGGLGELPEYRQRFYRLTRSFVDLVQYDAYEEWFLSRSEEELWNEPIAVAFIKHFDISKEDFARANEELRQIWAESGYDPATHTNDSYEVYNVDLIYSFDIELIREFFRWGNSHHSPDSTERTGWTLPEFKTYNSVAEWQAAQVTPFYKLHISTNLNATPFPGTLGYTISYTAHLNKYQHTASIDCIT